MRRATTMVLVALCVGVLLPLRSDSAPQRVTTMNGIGLIDYTRAPNFKLGDWVTYRVSGSSELGESDAYSVTVLISGEEIFWGEKCFWVETWTRSGGRTPTAVATLMSYAAFGDSMWLQNFQKYARKSVHEVDEDGTPRQSVMRRLNTFNRRDATAREITLHRDTLGRDTVHVPPGLFDVTKIVMRQGVGMNTELGDSTMRNEVRENRTIYYTPKVPITSVAREDIENIIMRKTWKIGESDRAEMLTREHAIGIARLEAFGSGGKEAQITPAYARRGLAKPAAAAPKPKTARRATR